MAVNMDAVELGKNQTYHDSIDELLASSEHESSDEVVGRSPEKSKIELPVPPQEKLPVATKDKCKKDLKKKTTIERSLKTKKSKLEEKSKAKKSNKKLTP